MPFFSRRSILGGGAALVGASAVTGFSRSSSDGSPSELSATELEALDIPVMLSISNAQTGELELLVGEQAITFTDRGLVAKIARASRNEVV